MGKPLVSIVIPVYNGSNYIAKAIDSALAQTYQNIEIIVVNDGSNDNNATEKIVNGYGDKVRYYKKANGGVSSALNFGIKNMRGEYFSWLSHDDEYTPTKIENQIILTDKLLKLYYCDDIRIDCNSIPLHREYKCKQDSDGAINCDRMLLYLLKGRTIDGCSLLIHKSVFEKCGLFDESLRYNQDFDMWVRFCLSGFDWYHSVNVDVKSRVHKQQVTQTRKDLLYKDSVTLSNRLIPQLIAISSKKNNYLYEYARRAARNNCQAVVKNCFSAEKGIGLFGFKDRIIIRVISLYGRIRPFFRKWYYRLFKKVKIN